MYFHLFPLAVLNQEALPFNSEPQNKQEKKNKNRGWCIAASGTTTGVVCTI
jgi:hypothetical protein